MNPPVSTNNTVIALSLPTAEATAIAEFLKRIGYEDCARIAIATIAHDSAEEADLMWSGVLSLRRVLAEAGCAPADATAVPAARSVSSDHGGRS